MSTESAVKFIEWALLHARPDTIPNGATLAVTAERCGVEPWEYLFGQSGQICTQKLLDERYQSVYKDFGWDPLTFETITSDWVERGAPVCDGAGLLNAYREKKLREKSVMTEHGIFSRLCYDKVAVGNTNRAYELGEVVCAVNDYGVMKRIGWVCGFDAHDEPLIIEARGLCYGVCITPFRGRGWTHRARLNLSLGKEDADAG